MLEHVGVFGVRGRLNEVIDFLNEHSVDVDEGWPKQVNEKFEGVRHIMGALAQIITENEVKLKVLEKRVNELETWKRRRLVLDLLKSAGEKVNDESTEFILQTLEGLDARVTNLEDGFVAAFDTPNSEDEEEPSETSVPNSEEAGQ